MILKPKNWAVFQHYKDRLPPWIKLHRDLLTDRKFMCLPIASKAIAPMLWLLASENESATFDASLEELQFRLHISKNDYENGIKPLIDNGFFEVVSGMLADCKQVATPETETERETKKEKKATVVATPAGVSDSVWQDFKNLRKAKKAPITDRVIEQLKAEADKAGWSLEQALSECVMRGWQAFKADWVNKSLLVNKFDVAHTTTPTPKNHDAALRKIEEDSKKAVPIPANIREKMASILGTK